MNRTQLNELALEKLEEVIETHIEKIEKYLDKDPNNIFFIRPHMEKFLKGKMQDKYKSKIFANENFCLADPAQHLIMMGSHPLITLQSYLSFIKANDSSEDYIEHAINIFYNKNLRIFPPLKKYFETYERLQLTKMILYTVFFEELCNHETITDLIIEGNSFLLDSHGRKTKIPCMAGITKINAIRNYSDEYPYCIYFESTNKFYLLLIPKKKPTKPIINISDKSSPISNIDNIELSPEGFEILEMLYFESTVDLYKTSIMVD